MTYKSLITLIFIAIFSRKGLAEQLEINIEIPTIDTAPYHKPYVAAWLETPKRKGVHTLLFWKEQSDWFKDLRQWWRKIGRNKSPNYDSVTGATRKPGTYQLAWDGILVSGEKIPMGSYVLHIEAVREQGNREYLRQKINLGESLPQKYILQGKTELGSISISVN